MPSASTKLTSKTSQKPASKKAAHPTKAPQQRGKKPTAKRKGQDAQDAVRKPWYPDSETDEDDPFTEESEFRLALLCCKIWHCFPAVFVLYFVSLFVFRFFCYEKSPNTRPKGHSKVKVTSKKNNLKREKVFVYIHPNDEAIMVKCLA